MRPRKRIPTDQRILDAIYSRYYDAFGAYSKEFKNRSSKIHVPVDIERIAQDLKVDKDIVFGRLYYHLEHKYGYKRDDGVSVSFFSLCVGDDIHCVNFPLMASVLADLQDRSRKHNWAIVIALGLLGIALGSLVVSIIALYAATLH